MFLGLGRVLLLSLMELYIGSNRSNRLQARLLSPPPPALT